MAYPYKLYGGAQRPDALQFNEAFNQALLGLYNAAPPEVQAELGLNSGYRSIERQRQLWEGSDKTGKWVAPPGKSQHNFGTAADLYGFGLGGNNSVSPATRAWVNANAAAHGLYFPMGHEPWHIQLRGEGAPTSVAGDQTSPLADTMASAAIPLEEIEKQRLYSGLASGLASGSDRTQPQSPEITGDPTGAPQPIGLDIQSASFAPQASPRLAPVETQLADLFQVKGIGGAAQPTRPVRRV